MRLSLKLCGAMAAAVLAEAAVAQTPVDLELVLAVDVSGSVDQEEAALQRRGYVEALNDPRVVEAIQSGQFGRIAVAYVEWAGPDYQQVVIDWREIADAAAASAFAAELAESPLASARWTAVGEAIAFVTPMFDRNAFEGARRVIDVSGDGATNRGRPAEAARDAAVAAGITINGLPILNDRPNPMGLPSSVGLDLYYENSVIGGPGAFVTVAEDFGDFGRAIQSKLIREIADIRSPAPAARRAASPL